MTLKETLRDAIEALSSVHASARLDAQILLSHVLGEPRHYAYAHPEQTMPPDTAECFESLVERRRTGVPIAYLVGQKEFWSLALDVCEDTLIPRPETECLVEYALDVIPPGQRLCIADLGTGCGAIAAAIALERPDCEVVATDVSPRALQIAASNLHRHRITNVELREGDWIVALGDDQFDLIISNPPYVAEDDPHLGIGDVRFEPRVALTCGSRGLACIETICRDAPKSLRPGAAVIVEHGATQRDSVHEVFERGGYHNLHLGVDYAGLPRFIAGQHGEPCSAPS